MIRRDTERALHPHSDCNLEQNYCLFVTSSQKEKRNKSVIDLLHHSKGNPRIPPFKRLGTETGKDYNLYSCQLLI